MGKKFYRDGKLLGEIIQVSISPRFIVRNVRYGGPMMGVCFTTDDRDEIRPWLDKEFPGWTFAD